MLHYYEKFEVGEACQSAYQEEIVRSESIEEIVDIVEDMLVTLMTHIANLHKESHDISDLSRSKLAKNLQETIRAYEREIKNISKVANSSLGYD